MFRKAEKWLRLTVALSNSTRLSNRDLVPLPPERRTWGFLTYLGFWAISNINISCWMSASSLLDLGLSLGHVLGIVVLSNFLVAILCLTNSYVGATWHIGYAVTQRTVFGMFGSYIMTALRAMISIVWFGAQAWIGGLCITVILSSWSYSFFTMPNTFPESVGMSSRDLVGFVLYYVISIALLLCIRPEKIDRPTTIANVLCFLAMLALCIWAGVSSDVVFDNFTERTDSLGWTWIFGITTWIGSLAAAITNQSDFSRFSKNKIASFPGTILAYMIPGTLVPFFGIVTSWSSGNLYGENFWNPLDLALRWLEGSYSSGTRAAAFFLALFLFFSQLCQNILANAFAGGMDLSGMFPKFINIRRGSVITALLSWVVQPWLFFNTSSIFLEVMSSFSVFLSPLIGVMICDYYLIRKRNVILSELYTLKRDGSYYYFHGVNLRAITAWVVGWAIGLPGMISVINHSVDVGLGLVRFYDGAAIFEFIISFILYYALCRVIPIENAGKRDDHDYFGTFTPSEAEKMGISLIPMTELPRESLHSPYIPKKPLVVDAESDPIPLSAP